MNNYELEEKFYKTDWKSIDLDTFIDFMKNQDEDTKHSALKLFIYRLYYKKVTFTDLAIRKVHELAVSDEVANMFLKFIKDEKPTIYQKLLPILGNETKEKLNEYLDDAAMDSYFG